MLALRDTFLFSFLFTFYYLISLWTNGPFPTDVSTLSSLLNAATYVFAGVACKGKANRYFIISIGFISILVHGSAFFLDMVLPDSGYIRVTVNVCMGYAVYMLFSYRHLFAMKVNAIFGTTLPVRETNMTLMYHYYLKLWAIIKLLIGLCTIIPFALHGVPINELFTPYIQSGNYIDYVGVADNIALVTDGLLMVGLIVHTLIDRCTPDLVGMGSTQKSYPPV